jgi:hypothetical protein
MGHIMESEKEEIEKYQIKGSVKADFDKYEEKPELMTNIEAFEQGKFPGNLAEKFENPPTLNSESMIGNIKLEHKKMLEDRPIPELLESANLIGSLEELRTPAMSKLYEEKRLSVTEKIKKIDNRK